MSKPIIEAVESLLGPILQQEQVELVEIEYVKEGSNWFLRVYIDKEGGIDIDDCGRVSEQLSERLDAADPIPSAYFLEVSSPGAERPLKKPDDYRKAVGKHVFIMTREPLNGEREFEGQLLAYAEEEAVTVQIGKKRTVAIPCAAIASARLAVVF